MRRLARLAAAAALALLVAACGGTPDAVTPSLLVEPARFEIVIAARGELRAATSTPIQVPNVVMGPQVLTWIAAEGSVVEAGDVVARFDGEAFAIELAKAGIELAKTGLNREAKGRELAIELGSVDGNRRLVAKEFELAQRFGSADQRVYSRNEILDLLQDQAYLGSQNRYYDWKSSQSEQRSAAEIALLNTQAARHQLKHDQNTANLGRLELTAPHAGTLAYARNWWGEPPSAGQVVWPGMKLAELPDADMMEAKLHVLESEATGLAVEQRVEVRLDAAPQQVFAGQVKSIGQLAAPREKDSPVKYFEFIVTLAEVDSRIMRSGSAVAAKVQVADVESALVVPNQAIFSDVEASWVFVLDRSGTAVRREVQSGRRSATRTEIVAGLSAGERVALVRPSGDAP